MNTILHHPSASLTDAAAIRASVASAISLVCDLDEVISPGQTVVLKPNVFAPSGRLRHRSAVVVAVGNCARGRGRAGDRGRGAEHLYAKYRKARTARGLLRRDGDGQGWRRRGWRWCTWRRTSSWRWTCPRRSVEAGARAAHRLEARCSSTSGNEDPLPHHRHMAVKNLHGIVSDYDKLYRHCYRDLALARKLTDCCGYGALT